MKYSITLLCLSLWVGLGPCQAAIAQPSLRNNLNVPGGSGSGNALPQAPNVKSITAGEAQGLKGPLQEIEVWAGAGTNISFILMNETIQKVWLGDPSGITFDFDSPLCSNGQRSGNCQESNAMVVNLRVIQRLKFPNLPQATNTLLTIITETASKERRLYQFRVSRKTGEPKYAAVIVNPDAESSLVSLGSRKISLEAVEQGLQAAATNGLIGKDQRNEALQGRVENFISLVRNGTKPPEAAQRAGVSLALITRLAELGAGAPGIAPNGQPSLPAPPTPQSPFPPTTRPNQPLPLPPPST
jgi:hypothetical protein